MSDSHPSLKDSETKVNIEPSDIDNDGREVAAARSVKKGALLVLLLIMTSLLWYLVSDRLAPYTKQARVQGYVVGVAPKVGGLVQQVFVKNNQEVNTGDLLFTIDSSQYEIALSKARSDLEKANRQVEAGNANIDAAKANLVASQANEVKAQQDLSRLTRLHTEDPGTISVRRIEVSQASLKQAVASVDAAKANIAQAIENNGGSDKANNAILISAQTAVNKAKLDLKNTEVIASSKGVITDLKADIGQYANVGNAVMTLVAIHDVWITAEFTENNLGHLKAGSPVEILLDVLPGEVFTGKISSIGIGVNTASKQKPGVLPTIDNDRDWLRQSQRFPVIVSFDVEQSTSLRNHLRVGAQASVVAYTPDTPVIKWLAEVYIRLMSMLSYAY
jgi:multidrug resistance efflux pump